jgi:hypothetical protein
MAHATGLRMTTRLALVHEGGAPDALLFELPRTPRAILGLADGPAAASGGGGDEEGVGGGGEGGGGGGGACDDVVSTVVELDGTLLGSAIALQEARFIVGESPASRASASRHRGGAPCPNIKSADQTDRRIAERHVLQ